MAFEPFNLGNVLTQAEQINKYRSARDPNSTANQLERQKLANAQQNNAFAQQEAARKQETFNANKGVLTDDHIRTGRFILNQIKNNPTPQNAAQGLKQLQGMGMANEGFNLNGNEGPDQILKGVQMLSDSFDQAEASGKGKGFTLGGGQNRYDEDGNLIATGPSKEPTQTSDEKNFNLAQKNPAFKEFLNKNKDNKGLVFNQEKDLRRDFTKASGDFIKVRDAHTRILKSAENPSPAGDLALVFNFMKVLDPGSTVREGEFQTAASAKAAIGNAEERGENVPNFIKSAVDRLMKGTILLPAQRKDFLSRSETLFNGQLSNQKELENIFIGLATRNKLNPENVAVQFRLPDAGELPTVSTQDEFDALPSGSQFIEDGQTYRKP